MEEQDFISFKKVLLFGEASTGKSTFTNLLKKEKFEENIANTEEGKIII